MKRPGLAAILIGLALACVMTWPLAGRPGSVARTDTNDGRYSLWNVAWVAHALTTDPANLFNTNIFYPTRATLAFSDPNLVPGATGATLQLYRQDLWSNVTALVTVATNGSNASGSGVLSATLGLKLKRMSADGRFVVFLSQANDLNPNASSGATSFVCQIRGKA